MHNNTWESERSGVSTVTELRGDPLQEPANHAAHRFLATEHLLHDLKHRALSSGVVTVLSQLARFGLNFVGTVILVRLLAPEDFGLTALASTVVGFVRVFRDVGLSEATVQREGITHAQVSNLFWINVAVSGSISLALASTAPVLSWFYKEPRLTGIMIAMSSGVLMSGLTAQHMALLKRQMRFGVLAVIDNASTLCGFVAGVLLALYGWGYWSLIVMNVITALVALSLTWFCSGWRPQFPARCSGTKSLVGFGVNLTASGFVYSLARGADNLLIGKVYGPEPLGLYSRATALLSRPLEQFVSPIEAVFVPTLSRLQSEPERCRRTFLGMYEAMALGGCIFTGLLLGLARPLTVAVLGPKWDAAWVIFAGLAAIAIFTPACAACTWLIVSQGRGRDSLISSLVCSLTTIAAFIVGLPFGVASVAIFYSVSGFLIQIPAVYYIAGRRGPVRTKDLWVGLLWHLPVWGVVCGVAWLVHQRTFDHSAWVQLLIGVPAALIAGLGFVCIWPRSRQVALQLIDMAKQLLDSGDLKRLFQGASI
jgi:PST family polysaccharide transporter